MDTKMSWHPGLGVPTKLGLREMGRRKEYVIDSPAGKIFVVKYMACKLTPKAAALDTRLRRKIHKLYTKP